MISNPAISVIIPVFNVETYIERCVASIAAQSFRDFEVIFVDDCSPDRSMEVLYAALDRFHIDRVKFIAHDKNMGLAVSRVDGLNASKGSYIIQVDSDDYVHPQYLEKLYEAALSQDADMVICDFYEFDDNEIIEKKQYIPKGRSELVYGFLSGEVFNSVWTKLVKKSLLYDNEIFQIPGLNYLEDKSVAFRMAFFATKVVHVKEPLYYYNISNPNAITRSAKLKMIPQACELLKLIDNFFANHEADRVIIKGIHICRALIYGMIVMHGTPEQYHTFLPAIGAFKLSEVLCAKTIPIHYKLFLICHRYHLNAIVLAIRSCYRNYMKLRYNSK